MTQSHTPAKPWGGRFSQPTDAFVESFTASIHYDARLYRHDIRASQVHCRMLARQGILTAAEGEEIVAGLEQVRAEIEAGQLPFQEKLEDIHMHVEDRLTQLIGAVAGKLHTARSRNDQVATDLRLYLRGEVDVVAVELLRLQENLLDLAEGEIETVMPGFTHLQIAQPVSFAHHLLAYWEMIDRDRARLADLRKRINQLPLGSAALAGTPFPVDRAWVAAELGFDGLCENSLDAVSDRDFVIELAAAAALVLMHLSRFSEELILWSSPRFAFVELPDAFCTGSSIMPQKKNPDIPELVRGKTGRVNGHLLGLLTMMKGLPLAYNRDMQEDKEAIFDTVDTLRGCVRAFADLVPGITVRREAMAQAARLGYSTATDLADYLVRCGIPFREAHHMVGEIVRYAIAQGLALDELTITQIQQFAPVAQEELLPLLTVQSSINSRTSFGGTAFATVRRALNRARIRMTNR